MCSNEKQAEIVMDKLQELKERTDDINETMMEGAEEELDEADEMMDELDALIAEDEKKEAMGSLPSAPTTVHSAVAKPAPAKATAAEESLEGMLDAL